MNRIERGLLTEEERLEFVKKVLSKRGCLYCWPTEENKYSGKGLKNATYRDVYDCSGLVTSSIYEATGGKIDRRGSWNAQKLFDNCALVKTPFPGDLAFYGPSRALITHVMVYLGTHHPKDTVFGASGGDHKTTSPDIAMQKEAKVRGFKSANYRGDFIAFGRLVTNDD